jgi:thymidylate synthase
MITIKTNNLNDAWRKAFIELMENGQETDNNKYYRDEFITFEISDAREVKPDPMFPMTEEDLSIINHFMRTGENEDKVVHETTKIYYHRMFDEPNSQVEYMVKVLNYDEPMGDSQISLWDKTRDQDFFYSPCTLVLWARKKHGTLEFHTHAHSSDAYKKLLMNLFEFASFHTYLSERVNCIQGTYYHLIDSCHIHYEDLDKAKELYKQLKSQ